MEYISVLCTVYPQDKALIGIIISAIRIAIDVKDTTNKCCHPDKVLPPEPDPRSPPPDDFYLLAGPRPAEAPKWSTSVLCTGQGLFGYKVN